MATVVGVLLIVLCLVGPAAQRGAPRRPGMVPASAATPSSSGDDISKYLGVAHGWLYMIFVVVAFTLSRRARWDLRLHARHAGLRDDPDPVLLGRAAGHPRVREHGGSPRRAGPGRTRQAARPASPAGAAAPVSPCSVRSISSAGASGVVGCARSRPRRPRPPRRASPPAASSAAAAAAAAAGSGRGGRCSRARRGVVPVRAGRRGLPLPARRCLAAERFGRPRPPPRRDRRAPEHLLRACCRSCSCRPPGVAAVTAAARPCRPGARRRASSRRCRPRSASRLLGVADDRGEPLAGGVQTGVEPRPRGVQHRGGDPVARRRTTA